MQMGPVNQTAAHVYSSPTRYEEMKNTIVVFVVCCASLAPPTAASSQTPVCKTAADTSARLVAEIKAIMTPTNTFRLHAKVPVTPLSEISLITDENTCIRALEGLNAYIFSTSPNPPNPLPEYPVYVLRVGSYFGVFDPEQRLGEWHIIEFFDSLWNHVGSMLPF